MAINISRLRTWFAILAIVLIAVVAGFYFYARYQYRRAIKELPKKLGIEIQQSTEGFSLSKSEGGRTLFTVRASKAIQYKQGEKGGRAELRDVAIVLYGRNSDRFDQIYGSDFEYDPKTGEVAAKGEVHIDLEASSEGAKTPDQKPPSDLKNPIHLMTSGLVFNQKTGIANTNEAIEFSIPQANGHAKGATYDAHANQLSLKSDVRLTSTGDHASTLQAKSGVVTKEPRQILLDGVKITQTSREIEANALAVFLRDDNSIDHMVASGDVRMNDRTANAVSLRAPHADVVMGQKNFLRSAVFSGGVQFQGTAGDAVNGRAGKILLDFAAQNHLEKIRASGDVHLLQQPANGKGQPVEIASDALDINVHSGRRIESADTSGAARISLGSQSGKGDSTVITAGKFHAGFERNRLNSLHGEPNVRVVSSTPGQPDRTTSSRSLDVKFGATGQIAEIVQQGDFRFDEPAAANAKAPATSRTATADNARYSPIDQIFALSGSPRVQDGGLTLTAQRVRINRRTGDATADADVKTTYSELKQEPSGALLATSDPVHVTSKSVTVKRTTGVARYTGGARLWQGSNIIEAPTIEFDRTHRGVVAAGSKQQPVSSVFVQADKAGKTTPVVVTATRLEYVDANRRARYSGGVTAKGAGATISADHIDILLQATGQRGSVAVSGPSQLNQIIAEGNVAIQQAERLATGEKLVYTSSDGRFVLTGGPPVITDAERGSIRGDSLTFYSRDDKVVVESGNASRTVTHTKVSR